LHPELGEQSVSEPKIINIKLLETRSGETVDPQDERRGSDKGRRSQDEVVVECADQAGNEEYNCEACICGK
jgi:hypothetical protein